MSKTKKKFSLEGAFNDIADNMNNNVNKNEKKEDFGNINIRDIVNDKPKLIRRGLYFRQDQIDMIDHINNKYDIDKSEIIRVAFDFFCKYVDI